MNKKEFLKVLPEICVGISEERRIALYELEEVVQQIGGQVERIEEENSIYLRRNSDTAMGAVIGLGDPPRKVLRNYLLAMEGLIPPSNQITFLENKLKEIMKQRRRFFKAKVSDLQMEIKI